MVVPNALPTVRQNGNAMAKQPKNKTSSPKQFGQKKKKEKIVMKSFEELLKSFETYFSERQFPSSPATLYDPAQYILGIGGKRVRPVCVLMGNELFDDLKEDAYHVAAAVELFHNFTLIHDDIMDKAPLRRGMQTVHTKYGEPTAILAGMLLLFNRM